MVEFTDQVHACRAASVPAISVVTVEQKDVRQHLCQYAVTRGSQKTGVRPRVFEWRLVDGFKELAVYKKVNKTTQVMESAKTNPISSVQRLSTSKAQFITHKTVQKVPRFHSLLNG